jgi:diaminopimelate decarboxylase
VVIAALGGLGLEIVLEPGRSIAGPAGLLLTRVAYLKQGHGRKFALVDAAMNDLLRPALYDAWHDIVPCGPGGAPDAEPIDVVGPVCETGDFLGRDRRLPVRAGDLLAVMRRRRLWFRHEFQLQRPAPRLRGHGLRREARVVRQRETVEELWRGERCSRRRRDERPAAGAGGRILVPVSRLPRHAAADQQPAASRSARCSAW